MNKQCISVVLIITLRILCELRLLSAELNTEEFDPGSDMNASQWIMPYTCASRTAALRELAFFDGEWATVLYKVSRNVPSTGSYAKRRYIAPLHGGKEGVIQR